MSEGNIYGLIDTRTSDIRYVGYTAKGVDYRAEQHWRERKRSKTHKNNWLCDLWDSTGNKPSVVILEKVVGNWEAREIYWILKLPNLTNTSIGGSGRRAGTKLTDDHKKKISLALSGMKFENRKSRSNIKTYNLVNPEGTLVKVSGLEKFCSDNGLSLSAISKVLFSNQKQHKGWTRYSSGVTFQRFVDPHGIEHTAFEIKRFAENNDLNYGSLRQLISGKITSLKGWRLYR